MISYDAEKVLIDTKKLLKELIEIPSVTGDEKELAVFIKKKLDEYGMDEVELQHVCNDRYNVIGHIKGKEPGNTILLTGHLDTVDAGNGWTKEPFRYTEEDGKIYGRGSNDMKAGIAIIMQCVKEIAKNKSRYKGSVIVAFLCDEEAYSIGVKEFVKKNIVADFAIAAEPEYDMVEIGAVGKVLISVLVSGVASHAATPQLGINAIDAAAEFIAKLNTIDNIEHEKMGKQPFVVLKITGGYEDYSLIVPEQCKIIINKHIVPGESRTSILKSLEKLAEDLNTRAKFSFSIEEPFYPPFEVEQENRFVIKLCKKIEEVTGEKIRLGYGDGVCDSNYIVPKCNIPTVCYGPSGGNMHGADEWVDINKIDNVLKIYYKFLFENN